MSDAQKRRPPPSCAVLAREVLETFERVEQQASHGLQSEDEYLTAESIGLNNPVREAAALRQLQERNRAKAEAFAKLRLEPAIARVVVSDDKGVRRTLYVCRQSVLSASITGLISYRSPLGAICSYEPGETFKVKGGPTYTLHEVATLNPRKPGQWDSVETEFASDEAGIWTLDSLRDHLEPTEARVQDLLASLLAEEAAVANVVEGRRRGVIAKMGLRDRPVLARYQDQIFRLPLSSRLLILGPPGTGKTTTLIRRLGQKLDEAALDDDERALVQRLAQASELPHAQSWIMFTPTDLLRHYLKEAFARENIAAPEPRISTWSTHREHLARNRFGILRTQASNGIFVLKEQAATLALDARERPIDWYEDFDAWQRGEWLASVRKAAEALRADSDRVFSTLAAPVLDALEGIGPADADSVVVDLVRGSRALQARAQDVRDEIDARLNDALNLQLNRDRHFLEEFARFLDTLQDAASDSEDDEDDDGEDDAPPESSRTALLAAVHAYRKSQRTVARAKARGGSLKPGGRSARIVEWLGDRGLAPADQAAVGRSLLRQALMRRLLNPARSYIAGVSRRYRAFRRLRQPEGTWYQPSGAYLATDLHPLELDIVLLAMLRSARGLLQRKAVQQGAEDAQWSPVRTVSDAFRIQVLVDEATDFSPIQLACMAALAHPQSRSFFACGDFNQRLTAWGSRSVEEMRWACPGIEDRTMLVAYRQSHQLNELARAIVALGGGDAGAVALPKGVDNNGVAPALAEHRASAQQVADWLAERVCEIESFVRTLPSIAVLVTSEAEVEPLAQALSERLADNNIRAVACRAGQSIGHQNDLRVFSVEFIKGLEFEAVFFVGIDRLAAAQPDLFDKYLYVGTTRAATYLGMTCEAALPQPMAALRPHFVDRW